jgi:surface carbohydrate biosynthesis protein (TIGR04326 family)
MIDPSTKKDVTLVYASPSTIRNFLKDCRKEIAGSWVFFGTDIFLENTITEVLKKKYKKIEIAERLQEIAKESRIPMVDYVGNLSTIRHDDCWWLTTLSEKSPSSSHLFLHICYLKLGMELSRKVDGALLIICESRSLMKSLQSNLSKNPEYSVSCYDSWNDSGKQWMKKTVGALFEKTWFLARYTGRLVIARLFSLIRKRNPAKKPADNFIVLHSWADIRSFSDKNSYQDIYFGKLGDNLTQKGICVYYLLDVIPTIWYPSLVHAALRSNINFFLMEDFISWADLIKSVYRVWNLPSQITDIPLFGELDIQSIVNEDLYNERYTSMGEHAFLSYLVCKKIGRDFVVKNFIFTYENQACQKLFALAFRKYSPKTTLIGYVHTYAIPMYTLYSISEKEKNLMPLPDKIIVNGEQSKKYLVACGYPENIIFLGGALRHEYLWSTNPGIPIKKDSFNLLVAASVNINEAVELIQKCLAAFSGKLKYNLIIKTHPTLPFRKILKFFPVLPDNIVISETPIQELLKNADIVLYTSSTVAIEAVALRVPVIHVKSDHIIDMNFFDGDSAIPSFSDPGEIARVGEQILLRHEKLPWNESERLVKKYFLPVDDSVISLFIATK